MEFMLDTLNIEEYENGLRFSPCGVTSNPTIAKKEGDIDFLNVYILSVTSSVQMLHYMCKLWQRIMKGFWQTLKIRELAPENVYIKVPVTPLVWLL